MRIVASCVVVLLLQGCVSGFTPPTFDLEYAKSMQVGVAFHTDDAAEVRPSMDGTVVAISDDENNPTNLGRYVIVEHTKLVTTNGRTFRIPIYFLYAMMGRVDAHVNDVVGLNAKLGVTGPSGKISDIEKDATFLFGVFSATQETALDREWGSPITAYGRYWYDPGKVIGVEFPPPENPGGSS